MKKFILVIGLLCSVSLSWADDVPVNRAGNLGIGIGLGQPMGATVKFWLSSNAAVDAFMGYHFNSNFDFHSDVLWHLFPFSDGPQGPIPLYAGFGARVLGGNDSQFGFRIPLGIAYLIPHSKAEFFAEAGPVIKLTSGIGADADGMVGIRMYTY